MSSFIFDPHQLEYFCIMVKGIEKKSLAVSSIFILSVLPNAVIKILTVNFDVQMFGFYWGGLRLRTLKGGNGEDAQGLLGSIAGVPLGYLQYT